MRILMDLTEKKIFGHVNGKPTGSIHDPKIYSENGLSF